MYINLKLKKPIASLEGWISNPNLNPNPNSNPSPIRYTDIENMPWSIS